MTPKSDIPQPTKRHPRVTFYVSQITDGEANRQMMTRHQPGEPLFASDYLIGYILQEPQSDDVEPTHIIDKMLTELGKGFFSRPPATAPEIIRVIMGDSVESAEIKYGLIKAVGKGNPHDAKIKDLHGFVLFWTNKENMDEQLHIVQLTN